MRKYIYTLIAFSFYVSNAIAQELPIPEFSGVPQFYDAASNSLRNFERPLANLGTRATGLYSAEKYVFINGLQSPIKFESSAIPIILFKTINPSDDPFSAINLLQMQVNSNRGKTQREFILGKVGLGNAKTTIKMINLDFEKISQGVYKIVIGEDLKPGEYVFGDPSTTGTNIKAFSFSVIAGNIQNADNPSGKKVPSEGPKDPLGQAIYNKIQEDKTKKEDIQAQLNTTNNTDKSSLSDEEKAFISSQKKIEAIEQERNSSLGKQGAFVIDLPFANQKDIEKQLEKQLSTTVKPKITKEGNEVIYSGVVNSSIANEPFNLIAQFAENPTYLQVCAFFHLGGVDFISSSKNKEQYVIAKSWLESFAKEVTKNNYTKESDLESKKLKKLLNELQSLSEAENKALSKVEKAKSDNINKESLLIQNTKDQDLKNLQINQKKIDVEKLSATPGDELKVANDALTAYKSALNNLQKENTSLQNSIVNNNTIIKDEENKAALLRDQQLDKNTEINISKKSIRNIQLKIIAINN